MDVSWDFADAIRENPVLFLRKVIRSISRMGNFSEYLSVECFLTEEFERLVSAFKIPSDVAQQYLSDNKIEPAWDILQMLLEGQISLELRRLAGTQIGNKRFLARNAIGGIIVHLMLFFDTNIIHGEINLPVAEKSYTSVADTKKIFLAAGSKLLPLYIRECIRSTDVQESFINFLTREGRGSLEEGAKLFTLFIVNTSTKNLETDVQAVLRDLGNRILQVIDDLGHESEIFECADSVMVETQSGASTSDIPSPVETTLAITTLATSRGGFPVSREDQPPGQRTYMLEDVLGPFVEPHMEIHNFMTGTTEKATLDQIIQPGSRYLLTAPPWGGKTRIQREIATREKGHNITDLFIDLNDFVHSGIHDIYAYTARTLRNLWDVPPKHLPEIRERLEVYDQSGKILWHLDKWDDVDAGLRPGLAISIAPLQWWLLSTANPHRAAQLFQPGIATARDTAVLHGMITVLPFDKAQIGEYISQYYELYQDDGVSAGRIQTLAGQLPGLATLPGGLEYLAEQSVSDNTSLNLLKCFITNQLALDSTRNIIQKLFEKWAIIELIPSDLTDECFLLDPNTLVGRLAHRDRQQAENDVAGWFSNAVSGKILAEIPGRKFEFTVPEIGFWLIAEVICTNQPIADLHRADIVHKKIPRHQFSQILVAYATQRAERQILEEFQRDGG